MGLSTLEGAKDGSTTFSRLHWKRGFTNLTHTCFFRQDWIQTFLMSNVYQYQNKYTKLSLKRKPAGLYIKQLQHKTKEENLTH